MEELKPCPFCGKTDSVIVSEDTPRLYVVVCTGMKGGCGARSLFSEKRETAIFWWNRRAPTERAL